MTKKADQIKPQQQLYSLKDAAVSGKSIYVERVYISSGAAITVTIGEGETTGAVTTVEGRAVLYGS